MNQAVTCHRALIKKIMCSERRVLDGIFWNEMVEPKTKCQSFSDKKQVLMWQLGT